MSDNDKMLENSTYIIALSLILASLIIAASIFYSGGMISSSIQKLNMSVTVNGGTISNGTNNTQTPAINITGSPVEGSDSAKVTIVEFSDFQCPYCQAFWQQTLPQLKTDYIDTGKVKFVYKYFPLSFHQYAESAAEAAACAADQGKFWQMHDELYQNQAALTVTDLKRYASDIGLDNATFSQCLDSGEKAQLVQSDLAYGTQLGVTGTPSFFINGKLLVGAQPYATFKQNIDAALAAS